MRFAVFSCCLMSLAVLSGCATGAAPTEVAEVRMVFPVQAPARPLCDAKPLERLALTGQVASQELIDQALHDSHAAHARVMRDDHVADASANPARLNLRVSVDNRIITSSCG
jgi:hypothetical protein